MGILLLRSYNRVAVLARALVGTHPSSMTRSHSAGAPPRVLLVMAEQWPRALPRAALREVGFDAVGTRTLGSALRVNPDEPDRGPIGLVILDQSVLGDDADGQLAELVARN